ncbi:MAG: hypothetical protein J6L81_03125 [Clostridia bacterium]|nr:hypothetical protein [Clostridia bacterium]
MIKKDDWLAEHLNEQLFMNQPTKEDITQKIKLLFAGELTREDICNWASAYIVNDDRILVQNIDAWHYLVAISNIDEMISAKDYLFSDEDIQNIMNTYI